MKKILFLVSIILITRTAFGQQIGIGVAQSTSTAVPQGIMYNNPPYQTTFLYTNQYLNHYGYGFYSYDDHTSIGGLNAYVSGYFGLDFFTAGQRRFRINASGQSFFDQNLWANNGATISSDFSDNDPNNSWSSNLSVRNNNGAIGAFSRLSFVSESGGFGAITVRKTGEFTGDMYFQVRNGSGFYTTPLMVGSNGIVAVPTGNLEIRRGDGGDTKLRFYSTTTGNSGWYSMGLDMSDGKFKINAGGNLGDADHFTMDWNGNVGIGATNPDAKLAVKGQIHTQEVKVDLTGAMVPDYVFEREHKLISLSELETYLKQNKHLPEMPSAKELEAEGMKLKEMNLALLKKVEELTLYVIEQHKQIEELKKTCAQK